MASKTSTTILLNLQDERMKSDKRHLGGMLMLTGLPALVFPLAGIVSAVGIDTSVEGAIPTTQFIASIFVVMMGLMSIPTGYLQCVHDWGNRTLTGFLILWTQLAWVPFITDMVAVGKGAVSGDAFIPLVLQPTSTDVKYVGVMGILGILCYGTGFLGSLAFMQFSLYAYQSNKPNNTRPGSYYQSRLRFYCFVNFVGGFSQLFLGVYLYMRYGNGPLEAPVSVAMYFVYWPEISMAVGSLQVVNSFYGMIRSTGCGNNQNNCGLQIMMLLQWYAIVILQITVQVGYAPGGMAAPKAPSQVMLTLGINVMVAYLDYKMRTTPEDVVMGEEEQEEAKDVADPSSSSAVLYKSSNNFTDEAEDVDNNDVEDVKLTPSAEASA